MNSHKDIEGACYLQGRYKSNVFYEKQKDIFWPFFLWRVMATKEQASLNIFQLLLLKLVRAGCRSIEKLCVYSQLDKELIGYILAQLNNDGYLSGWEITSKSILQLEGKEVTEQEKSSYYLMQEATSGKLIPRVLSSLTHIDKMDFSSKYPKILLDKESGKVIKPFLLNHNKEAMQPSIEQMNNCLRDYRRELKQREQADLSMADSESYVDYSIQLIDSTPINAFVHIKLFSTPTYGDRFWYLSDPTNLTQSIPEFNEIGDEVLKLNSNFSLRVDEIIGIADKEHETSYQKQQEKFEEQAKVELLSKYPWVQNHSLIEKHLLGMLRLKKQVEFEKSPRFELLDALLNELQRVLEAWFKTIIKPTRSNSDWKIFVKRWNKNKAIYQDNKAIREQVFLRIEGISRDVAYQLSTVNPRNIRGALTFGKQSLKPLVAGFLLKLPNIAEGINKQYPKWLDLIIPLANDRNNFSSHSGVENISKDSVLEHLRSVDKLLIVLEKLLGNK